ncbi:T-cell surface glycoprotein CD3 gamma chain-like [Spea bombifrons]|uniref:T-cell surface glycoprotein CD3 gamma chain-like n=1 Tax=Spea bombifrons TaxID=233779 RepID=UPI00234BE215|nr:T-cell surface glycoprotein CD3 gamma chain-like [Spea bombifrons]
MDGHSPTTWTLMIILCFAGTFADDNSITARTTDGKLFLQCPGDKNEWLKDHYNITESFNSKELPLGSIWDDPRGLYTCESSAGTYQIEVYVRMCQNCVELDSGTIAGFLVADVIMIALIAVAVYCVAGTEARRPARASDKQSLIPNETLYQPLRDRQDDQYSQLNRRKN